MLWLLAFTIIAVAAAFILAPRPQDAGMSPAGLDDFTVPDNSSSRVVPRIYGTAYVKGNCIYYGNLNNREIRVSS